MGIAFAIIAAVTIASAVAAMSLRNLVHCALALVVTFAGLAAAYLQLDAQFVGFAQILVYVGAVSILIVFAIVLTRSGDGGVESVFSTSWLSGVAVVVSVLGVLAWAISKSNAVKIKDTLPATPDVTVQKIGEALMNRFVLPLEVIGLLLTAALIGAVIIAMHDKPGTTKTEHGELKVDEHSEPSSILHPPSSGRNL
jgi:NADH:ubiquinone oxidoreductase subunit 6 (subunit J)